MIAVIKFYFRLFLFSSIALFLLRSLSDFIIFQENHLNANLFDCLLFGLFMSFVLGTTHILSIKTIVKQNLNENNLNPKQSKHISSSKTPLKLIRELNKIPKWDFKKLSNDQNVFSSNTKMTWKSFGENVHIKVDQRSEDQNFYTITSVPSIKFTLVDYGVNLLNIKEIEDALMRE